MMESSTTDSGRAVSVLFGPQCSEFNASVSQISRRVRADPSISFIDDLVQELPTLWPTIKDAWPALGHVPGGKQLTTLSRLFRDEPSAAVEDPMNVLLTPVTVLRQIVDFIAAKDGILQGHQVVDTQGFCVGFLTAVAIASSHHTDEFRATVSAVVRLAVCIGAVVDLDEVSHGRTRSLATRWKTPQEYKQLEQVMASFPGSYISCFTDTNAVTVNITEERAHEMMTDLTDRGLSTMQITLRGRFHHPRHGKAVEMVSKLCERDSRFQMTRSPCSLVLPLRSNVDGEVIKKGPLHTIALKSLLISQCRWHTTVTAAFDSMKMTDKYPSFMPIGTGQFVPRLVRSRELKANNSSCRDHHQNDLPIINGTTVSTNGTSPVGTRSAETGNGAPRVAPIAITGMGCRYAQADSPEQLWDMLELGRCAVRPMPDERFKMSELLREPKGPFWGNYLDEPEAFDCRFFGISPREAQSMDPQQRLLLEVAYEAMESAGYCGLRASNLPKDVGCYVGVGSDDYTANVGSAHANAYSATGTLQAFNSGRISHHFGWTGPSLIVDSACSSAAVAVHLACKALHNEECSIAVAGGVNVMTNPMVTQNLAAASFLSPTGASKAFDIDADGYCRGEGAGLVVLRPLDDAIRNGDPVLGVITGSAVNQGSNCSPITVPDSNSQKSLYCKALDASGVIPKDVTYVEAHGTGTQVGDPIEFDSIRKTFAGPDRNETLYVGSIKDNIGHAETASGVAGILKTILMMQKGRIPKQANFSRLNPKIESFQGEQVVIPTQSTNWKCSSTETAMVTNYGAAGSNAALVLRKYNAPADDAEVPCAPASEVPVIIAAKTAESFRSYCDTLYTDVRNQLVSQRGNIIGNIAYNLAMKQNRDMEHIGTFSAPVDDPMAFLARLESLASTVDVNKQPSTPLPVILCFGGQSGNMASISKSLFSSSPVLQYHLMQCEKACQALDLPSLFPTIFEPHPIEDLVSLHCILFSIQYASAKSWIESGLQVDRMIGHSFGQLTALCVGGGLSLPDAMGLVSQRALLIQTKWGSERGVMLAIEGPQQDVQRVVDHAIDVDVACFNGPQNVVLAGDQAAIREIENFSADKRMAVRTKRLKNTHAFHSRLVDNIVPGLTRAAEALRYSPPSIPVEACSEEEGHWTWVTPDKIVQHSRMPVYFKSAVQRVAQRAQGPAVWLEAGSGSPIIPMVQRVIDASSSPTLSSAEGHVYQSINLAGLGAQQNLAQATCNLWNKGVKVQFWPFQGSQAAASYNWVNIPPYQFAKAHHWLDYDPFAFQPPATSNSLPSSNEPMGLVQVVNKQPDECLFAINTADSIYRTCTQGHAVVDQNLCPASLYIEMIIRAARILSPSDTSPTMPHLQDLAISSPLVLDPEGKVYLRFVRARGDTWSWSLSLSAHEGDKDPTTLASGEIGLYPFDRTVPIVSRFHSMGRLIDLSRVEELSNSPVSSGLQGSTVYQAFRRVVNYADYYRGVQKVFATSHEAAGLVSLASSPTKNDQCDPVLLDNFIQVAGIHVNCLLDVGEQEVYVCSRVGEIMMGEPFISRDLSSPQSWTVYSNIDRPAKNQVVCDIFVMDRATGCLAVAILSATFACVPITALTRTLRRLNRQSDPIEAPLTKPQIQTNLQVAVNGTTTPSQSTDSSLALTPAQTSPGNGGLQDVQEMLKDLLGVEIDELQPSSSLADIGVDSLMRTEVLVEIKNRFDVSISSSTLVEIQDIQSLVQFIFPESSQRPAVNGINGTQPPLTNGVSVEEPPKVNGAVSVVPNGERTEPLAPAAESVFADVKSNLQHSQNTKFVGFCDSVFPKQMALVTAYVVEAFQSLGVSLDALLPGQVLPEIYVLPQHNQVSGQLKSVLEYSGLVESTDKGLVRTEKPVDRVPSHVLQQEIVHLYPQHASEHKLLHITGSRLADCLTGKADPLALLFGDAEARNLIGDVYTNAPMFKSATQHLAHYLTTVLGQFDSSQEIKILEIGAGTGGTTSYLLSELTKVSGLRFRYTFTDLSSSLLALARKKFKDYDCLDYEVLNVEQDPPPKMLEHYDVIISTNCIHATRNLIHSCSNINKLLRKDGILCLVELTRNLFWFDLVFGLLEGWWLFNDGRTHALASEQTWDHSLRQSGYNWVDWTRNDLEESRILRVIVASPTQSSLPPPTPVQSSQDSVRQETILYGEKNGTQLFADIYYPRDVQTVQRSRPIALLIHGGGHIMLSRKDLRPTQIKTLLDAGFLPVGIDYRLCPEVSLLEGPMKDVRDALGWARRTLPTLTLKRSDIQPDGDQVVAVGWSTGGHLAMSLSWTAQDIAVEPPQAVLAFYCPTDYEDPFWSQPNFPFGKDVVQPDTLEDLWDAVGHTPITSYNPPAASRALGGWMAPKDPRSRIALHMNWTGQTLPVLLYGHYGKKMAEANNSSKTSWTLPRPTTEQIQSISPQFQIRSGRYQTPTFLIHGTLDDLIPVEQVQRTHDAFVTTGVECELRVLDDTVHLFDIVPGFEEKNEPAVRAIVDGYDFLLRHVSI